MYFPDGGCVRTLRTLCVYTTAVGLSRTVIFSVFAGHFLETLEMSLVAIGRETCEITR